MVHYTDYIKSDCFLPVLVKLKKKTLVMMKYMYIIKLQIAQEINQKKQEEYSM